MLQEREAVRDMLGDANCGDCGKRLCIFLPSEPGRRTNRRRFLARGDRLDSEDVQTCMKFWVVVSGLAATCTAFEDGRRQIVGLETAGETICSLMAGPGSQNWLEALSDCMVCEIDLSPNAAELHADPAFLAATFQVVHRRLERLQNHVTSLGRLDSVERVTLFLAEMAVRSGATLGRPCRVILPMSREDIADYLGLNSETVSRILSRLKKSGLVKFNGHSEFIVPDLAELGRRLPVDLPEPRMYANDATAPGEIPGAA